MKTRTRISSALLALLTLLVSACSDVVGPENDVGAVVLEASSVELEIGETIQLIATVLDTTGVQLGGRPVTWSTSNENIASVSTGGLVTAMGPGRATITGASQGKTGTLTMAVVLGPGRAETVRPHEPGQIHDESLETYDCVLMEAPFADGWELTFTEPTTLMISMTSVTFDALLLVTTPDMQVVAYDDDGGGGSNAQLLYSFPAGTYIAWATSFRVGVTGSYRLSSEIVEMASCDDSMGTLALGSVISGALTSTSCMQNGSLSDPWSLSLAGPSRVQIDLTSSDFDTVLRITDATGALIAYDDDGGTGSNSRWTGDYPAGMYSVWASSFGGRTTGNYRLAAALSPGGAAQQRAARAITSEPDQPSLEDLLRGDKAITTGRSAKR